MNGPVNLAEYLKLERPLAVLDLETTGFDTEKDRICQISITIHYTHRGPIHWETLVNPGIPITNSAESHKITDQMVADSPRFEDFGPELAKKMLNVDIMGFNVEFDIKFMRATMKRCGIAWPWAGYTIDAFEIFRKKCPRNLEGAYLEFGGEDGNPLPRGTKLEGAHNAAIDVMATEIVLRGQLLRFNDLPRTPKELQDFCFPAKSDWIDPKGKFRFIDGVPHITFGKYVKNNGGKPVPMTQVGRDYYKFMLDSDFEREIKDIAAAAMMGNYPVQTGQGM